MTILQKITTPFLVLSLILSFVVGCAKVTTITGANVNNSSLSTNTFSVGNNQGGSYSTGITAVTSTSSAINTAGDITGSLTSISYTLTISVPSSGGRIDVAPASKNRSYASGTSVTLLAVADQDHAFDSWGGDAAGIDTTITILMNSNKTVTANFIPM